MAQKGKKPDDGDGMNKTFVAIMCLLFLLVGLTWASRCNREAVIPFDKSGVSKPAK